MTAARVKALCVLAFAGTVISYYLRSPSSGWVGWGTETCLITATAGFAAGVLLNPERRRIPWLLLLAGQLLNLLGGSSALAYQEITGSNPYPGLSDVFELSAYLFFLAGLVMLSRSGRPHFRQAAESAVVALAIAVLAAEIYSYPLVIRPDWSGGGPLLTKLVTVAYPGADILLLVQIVVLASVVLAMRHFLPGSSRVSASFLLIVLGTLGVLASDSVFAYVILHWNWDQPSAADIGWLTWWGAWMLAFLYPSRQVSTRLWYLSKKGKQSDSS